ncbi:Fis family transcriptional regulator [Pseudodesulfovibrio sediminis]|uniref:Fis family transcriptional regulator n=2 Tax=Pseudodesulfovibrio sediminis TaxID=2810563 RepID=A0ABN6EVH4_9BACT|nr:Fis family transcriptional regulator [Pseudodesulfovibrio sediminis]
MQRLEMQCIYVETLEEGFTELQSDSYDVVLLDVHMEHNDDLSHIPKLLSSPNTPDVIVISENRDGDAAEQAIRLGAWDYLVKPFSQVDFEQCLTRCLQQRDAREKFSAETPFNRGSIIGDSPLLLKALRWVGIVARTKCNALILGETGTGKELFARAIHDNSDRKNESFTVVDCTNLPHTLAQSILFGHKKGTFTDAKENQEGLFKQADGGTIFLDEIADLDPTTQKSILRVLQERSFRPLSSKKEVKSDFRLVAATNKDLHAMVEEGTFRSDLYFRLKSCLITLPPLRERLEDLEPIASHCTKQICKEQGVPVKRLSEDYIENLKKYDWPGNVRELINTITYSVTNSYEGKILNPYSLPRELRMCIVKTTVENSDSSPAPKKVTVLPEMETKAESPPTLKEVRNVVVSQMEAEYLLNLMRKTDGDIKKACKAAGLSRARLYELLQKHDIDYRHITVEKTTLK